MYTVCSDAESSSCHDNHLSLASSAIRLCPVVRPLMHSLMCWTPCELHWYLETHATLTLQLAIMAQDFKRPL